MQYICSHLREREREKERERMREGRENETPDLFSKEMWKTCLSQDSGYSLHCTECIETDLTATD